MINWDTYKKIQRLKQLNYKKSTIANHLKISRTTLNKFWNISENDFYALFYKRKRIDILSQYEKIILDWLQQNKKLSAKKISRQLDKIYGIHFSERTMSRYLRDLRQRNWWFFNPL